MTSISKLGVVAIYPTTVNEVGLRPALGIINGAFDGLKVKWG